MAITLTKKAADRVEKYLASRGKGIGLRLGVKTTGCSGMAYTLEFLDEPNPEDQIFESLISKFSLIQKVLFILMGQNLILLERV
jgi:iron-sulfur cluster assembly protein